MTVEELAERLGEMYENARRNEAACQVHLFGILYASDIQACGQPVSVLAQRAGLSRGYAAEISKGIKLARYVDVKPEVLRRDIWQKHGPERKEET